MNDFFEKRLDDSADVCGVCGVPLKDIEQVFTDEAMGEIMTFCSEKCRDYNRKHPGEDLSDFEDEDDE